MVLRLWSWRSGAASAVCAILFTVAHGSSPNLEDYGPWLDIKTEPTFKPAILKIATQPEHGVPLDQHFITTLRTFSGFGPWGPQIFDSQGDLVFYAGKGMSFAYQDPHICVVGERAATHLCASQAIGNEKTHLTTIPRIYDSSYHMVRPSYDDVDNYTPADGHEFHVLPGGQTFLSTVYVARPHDVKMLEGGSSFADAWVFDSCFREVDTQTKEVVFKWCALDHIGLDETVYPLTEPVFVKSPPSEAAPYDWAHINSVDKNQAGDYLVSFKYLNQIVKVAGANDSQTSKPGEIVWRLGGIKNDFESSSPDLDFQYQHHARFVKDKHATESRDVISFFDNHCADHNLLSCSMPSSGKIVELDLKGKKAELVHHFIHPFNKSSWAGGSLDIVDDSVAISWGQVTEVSEYNLATGKLILHAMIGVSDAPFQYRTSRGAWKGFPQWRPKLLPYLRDCESRHQDFDTALAHVNPNLHLYASWNGATEVKAWKVAASNSNDLTTMREIGTYPRTSFETHIELSCGNINIARGTDASPGCFPTFFEVTALDDAGHPLENGRSMVTKVFVPPTDLLQSKRCNETECEPGFLYSDQSNSIASCALRTIEVSKTWMESIKPTQQAPIWSLLALFGVAGVALIFYLRRLPVGMLIRSKSLHLWRHAEASEAYHDQGPDFTDEPDVPVEKKAPQDV